MLDTAKAMIDADGRVDIFEFLLARVITMHLWESQNPHRVRISGSKAIADCKNEVLALLAVLARHGSAGPGTAETAFAAGLETLGMSPDTPLPDEKDWMTVLDSALPKLDRLKSAEKEKMVTAMAAVVLHDGCIDATEMELLRVSSHLIHVPLPLLNGPQQTSRQS